MRRWLIVATAIALISAAGLGVGAALRPAEPPEARQARMTAMGLLLLDDEAPGLYVLAVSDGSPAGEAGIRPGDRITQAGDTPLTSVAQLETLFAERNMMLPLTLNRQEEAVTVDLIYP